MEESDYYLISMIIYIYIPRYRYRWMLGLKKDLPIAVEEHGSMASIPKIFCTHTTKTHNRELTM